MTQDEIIATITTTARAVFKQPDLNYAPDLAFRNIRGFDSVLAVQFILATEQAFDIMIEEDEVDRMHTLGTLVEILNAKGIG